MSKDTTSMSLEDDVLSYLQQDSVNASGLVEQLVRNHIAGPGGDQEILRMRKQQIESELQSLSEREHQLENELELINSRLESQEEKRERIFAQAINTLDPVTLHDINPAITNWAEKAGMDPESFLDELREKHPGY